MLQKLLSRGQTGVERGVLDAAIELGVSRTYGYKLANRLQINTPYVIHKIL